MDNGVTRYIETTCKIYFVPGHMNCQMCPMLSEYPRDQCRRTGEYIIDSHHSTGFECPLEVTGPDIFNKEDNNV